MRPHAEGGFYAEVWQAQEGGASHIYYLLPAGAEARWHRTAGEELWLFHHGGKISLTLGGDGPTPRLADTAVLDEDHLHCLIPANTWQTAQALDGDVLVSCIVSPAFTEAAWELYKEQEQ